MPQFGVRTNKSTNSRAELLFAIAMARHLHSRILDPPNLMFSRLQKRDRHMIDGAKRKRRNGTKGEPRRLL
jgi:hypothetical protein